MCLAVSASAIAQQIPEQLLACAAIDADDARLACYDREMTGQLPEQRQSAARLAPAQEIVDQADSTSVDIASASVAITPASPLPSAAGESQPTTQAQDAEGSPTSLGGVPTVAPEPVPTESAAPATATMSSKADVENVQPPVNETNVAATTSAGTSDSRSRDSFEEFGMTEKLAQQRAEASGSVVPEEPKEPEQITAVITDIKRQPRGEHIVALDNGQIWQEEIASRYFPVEVGDTVIIKKRMLRGYRLVAESGKGFAVKRLR